jgi:hypothetical protein
MTFRGASGTLYRFGAGDPAKYVLEEDVPMFEARVDFKRANGSGPPLAPDRPILVTEMAPKREELVSA